MKAVRAVLFVLASVALLLGFAGAASAQSYYFVSVPGNYVYNPDLGARNDYCTFSPDQPPVTHEQTLRQAKVDFRGPCARHDLCYDGTLSKASCDRIFRDHMTSQCGWAFQGTGYLRDCFSKRDIYYNAVVRFGNADSAPADGRADVYREKDWVEANRAYLTESGLNEVIAAP